MLAQGSDTSALYSYIAQMAAWKLRVVDCIASSTTFNSLSNHNAAGTAPAEYAQDNDDDDDELTLKWNVNKFKRNERH